MHRDGRLTDAVLNPLGDVKLQADGGNLVFANEVL